MVLPIQYQTSVANPVENYLEGLKFNENLQDQRLNREISQFTLDREKQQQDNAAKAAQQAQAAEEAGQMALQTLLDTPNPSTKDYLKAWVSNPAVREEITSLRQMQDESQNNALISKNTNLYAAAKSGNIEVVKRLLKEESEAAKNSGDQQTAFTNDAALELLDKSPDEALKTIIAQSGMMLLGLKDPKFLEEINSAIGAETPEQTDAFKTLSARAEAGGLVVGSPEYEQFILNNGKAAPGGFRQASPEEAAQYGAASGQFGPDGKFHATEALEGAGFRQATRQEAQSYGANAGQFGPDGKFHAINPPSGFNLSTNPDGTFSLSQGPGAAKPLSETQSKAITYATRARGALADFEPVADQLIKRGDKVLEIVPLGLGREYQDPAYQAAQTAGTEFLHAILRKDTGAAITQEENEQYGRVYLPQLGDSEQVLNLKKSARNRALIALEAGMTPDAMIALEAASGTAKNFSTMTLDQIRALDPDALTEAEAEQALQRLEELGG